MTQTSKGKRAGITLLATAVLIGVAACGSDSDSGGGAESTAATTAAAAATENSAATAAATTGDTATTSPGTTTTPDADRAAMPPSPRWSRPQRRKAASTSCPRFPAPRPR